MEFSKYVTFRSSPSMRYCFKKSILAKQINYSTGIHLMFLFGKYLLRFIIYKLCKKKIINHGENSNLKVLLFFFRL